MAQGQSLGHDPLRHSDARRRRPRDRPARARGDRRRRARARGGARAAGGDRRLPHGPARPADGLRIHCRCCSATRVPASSKPSATTSRVASATASCSAGDRPAGRAAGAPRRQRRCRTPPRAVRRFRLRDGTRCPDVAARHVRDMHRRATRPPRSAHVELPPEQACLIGCAVATGVRSVLETAQVWEGARVA